MTIYTPDEIAILVRLAGVGDPGRTTLARIVATIMRESSGDPLAHGMGPQSKGEKVGNVHLLPKSGDPQEDSYGLGQINAHAHGDLAAIYNVVGGGDKLPGGNKWPYTLFDPQTNIRAMNVVSSVWTNWIPWGGGAEPTPQHFAAADKALAIPRAQLVYPAGAGDSSEGVTPSHILDPVAAGKDAVANAFKGFSSLQDAAKAMLNFLLDPHSWVRILQIVGGLGLLAMALYRFIK